MLKVGPRNGKDVTIVIKGYSTNSEQIKGVASNVGCGKSEAEGSGKNETIELEGCGAATKNYKGVASGVENATRDTIECGTRPTREPECGKPAESKKSEASETKSDEGCGTSKTVIVGCGATTKMKMSTEKDGKPRRKSARAVANPRTGGSRQGDLLDWIKKGEGVKVQGGVPTGVQNQERKSVAAKAGLELLQPYFRKELDWLKNRCTECGNSLSWNSYGQGVCTTILKPSCRETK